MNATIKEMMLAQAAWLEMESAIKSMEAAIMRGDGAGVEASRQKAHDMLDSHLDMKSSAMVNVLKAGGAT